MNYNKNDPRGWGGDPKRGAALGRRTIREAPKDTLDILYLARVVIDEDGYDPLGTYFGTGGVLWWVVSEDQMVDYMVRGDMKEVKRIVHAHYPKAPLHVCTRWITTNNHEVWK